MNEAERQRGDAKLQQRLEHLEIELVHQQRATEQLDSVIQELSKEILRLSRQHDRVLKKLDDLNAAKTAEPYVLNLEDEKPPHY